MKSRGLTPYVKSLPDSKKLHVAKFLGEQEFAMAPQGTGAEILGEKRAEGLTYLVRPQAEVHPTPTWPKEDNNPAWGKWTIPQ